MTALLRLFADMAWWWADLFNDLASELSDLATLVEGRP